MNYVTFRIEETREGEFVLHLHNHDQQEVHEQIRSRNLDEVVAKLKGQMAYFGVTPWYWRSQIWAGHLSYVQVGRKMLIDHKDVEAFIQKNKSSN